MSEPKSDHALEDEGENLMSERQQANAAAGTVTYGRDAPGAQYVVRPTSAEVAAGAPGTEAFQAASVDKQPVVDPGDDEVIGC